MGIPRLPGMTTSYPKLKRVRGAQRKAAQSDAVSRRRTAIPLVSAIFYAQKVNTEDSDSAANINSRQKLEKTSRHKAIPVYNKLTVCIKNTQNNRLRLPHFYFLLSLIPDN